MLVPFKAQLAFSNDITGTRPTEPKDEDRLGADPAVTLLTARIEHPATADLPRPTTDEEPWLHLVLAADTSWSMQGLIRNPSNAASDYVYELDAAGNPKVVVKDGVRRTVLLRGPDNDTSPRETLLAFYRALLERAPAAIVCSLLAFGNDARFLLRRGPVAACERAMDGLQFQDEDTRFAPLLDRIDELLGGDDALAVLLVTDGVWTDDGAHKAITERLRAMTSAHPGKLRLFTLGVQLDENQPLLQEYAQTTGSQTHDLITTYDEAVDAASFAKAFVDDLPLRAPETHQVAIDMPAWTTIWKIMQVRARGKNQTLMVYSPAAQDFARLLSTIANGGVRFEEPVALAPGETVTYHVAMSGDGEATEPRNFSVRIDGKVADSTLVTFDAARRQAIRAAKARSTTIASVNIYQVLARLTLWLRTAEKLAYPDFKTGIDNFCAELARFRDVNDRRFKQTRDALEKVRADIALREKKGPAWAPKEYVTFVRKITRTSTLVPNVVTRVRLSPTWRCLDERCLLSQGDVGLKCLMSTGCSPYGSGRKGGGPALKVPVGRPLFVPDINGRKAEAEWQCAQCGAEGRTKTDGVLCSQPDSVSAWDFVTDPWMEIYDLASFGDVPAFLDGYIRDRLARPKGLRPITSLQPPMNMSLVIDKRFFQQDVDAFRGLSGLESVKPPVFVERRTGVAGVRLRFAAPSYRLYRLFDAGSEAVLEEHAGGIFRVRPLDSVILAETIMLRFVDNHQE